MAYERINWEDYPNITTPINAYNLNRMDECIYNNDIYISKFTPVLLYSNTSGTNGTITLSQPYTDFSRIGVYAQGQYDNSSVYNEMYTSINYMTLACSSAADSNYDCTVWRTAFINFSEDTITFATNCSSSYHSTAGYNIGTNDGLKITRVVGYKY